MRVVTETRTLSGRYRIVGHLARGGMGDVFEAEDLSLGRTVAIKILHPNFASDGAFTSRFRREAQAAANLSHPNIVGIYDFGEDGDTYYMVMELIEGRTLRDIARAEGPLLPRRAAEIIAETAAALSVAHAAGVYHRDVKPGNIMLTPDGSVRVTDFGIARALDDSEELTRTGAVIGTATYFSPEQAQGLPADERSDIYSLGVVLYELLAGRPPFTGESPVAVAYQHVSEYATPPSGVNADVPAGLEAIVEKAMEKSPDARYQSAADLRNELLLWLRGDDPVALTTTTPAAEAATQLMQQAPPPPPTVPPDETARYVAAPSEPRSQSSYVVTIIGLLVALAVGVFILFSLLQSDPPEGPTTVEIPSLDGLDFTAASELLQNLGLRVRQQQQPSDAIPDGFVIRTDPPTGASVEEREFVTIVISSGPEQFPIPAVISLDLAEATARLEQNGFVLGAVEEVFSENVPAGQVVDQTPRPGQRAEAGTVVDLEVSVGPFAFTMPPITGLSEEAALQALLDAGIELALVEREFSLDILEGFVTRSEPAAGGVVGRQQTVTIWISDGPEPFTVPDLVGSSIAEAETLAQELGFFLVVEDDTIIVTDPTLDGVIAAQTPSEGEIRPGDEIIVQLGELLRVEVPDLIGLTIDEADELLDELGLVLEIVGSTNVEEGSPLDGRIATQEPAVDELLPVGSSVQVTIGTLGPGGTVPPPSP